MKRLFVSLYLLLSLSILGIGWTLDSLWYHNVDDSAAEDAPFLALASLLSEMPEAERARHLAKFEEDKTLPLSLLSASQVALSNNESLSSGRVFTIALDDDKEMRLVRVGEQVLMAGPMEIDPRENLRGLFTLFFYGLLAGVALLWVWPLSRDIRILREATEAFGRAKWDTRIALSKRSQVKSLADTFNEMARHISALIENQQHLTNAVSHEIRTPLARLKFALALLPGYCGKDNDDEKLTQFLADMQLDIKEMEQLLSELLTYASLEAPKEGLKFETSNLSALTRQVAQRLQSLSQVPIELHLPEKDVQVPADPSLIERALQNLITNAIRFAHTRIGIELVRVDNEWHLSVEDDGEGIPLADQGKIFEPFYRVSSSQNGNKGHGLGLAIIKRIMQRHKGKVSLESEPGKTRFTLHMRARS
ncbi:cell wall metabolism sensor histidine kinase WalK [Shewanella sp. FJAT-52076]|uniref:sensor histidine kinase n=1 Tax=Shewanella sp. FJAT-52076 TaxID=2864202 RepID=UPI001C65A009|nr:ATP-binding protein [Shewanella sp. FJAT-52076]QYJ74570.1 two-component sensor histidine kinase [Shewanella sp. FJAT-52076]